ncbi:DNA-protecting protein DprA, partial [Leptospira borgpetersenii serovar Hardjo-bovis]|nr:DNA-protecting protein DprA [Leptospira borgpetersenii serovar Hardjo-bovis]
MSPTELWLRLMAAPSFNGEQMLRVAAFMTRDAVKPADSHLCPGLTAVQIAHFLKPPAEEIEDALQWLDAPNHFLLTADDAAYPPQLRAISWFPGARLVDGD